MVEVFKRVVNIDKVENDVTGSSKNVIVQKKKALKTSISEGSASSFSEGIATTYLTPFARQALNASAIQIGIMSAVTGLIAPLAQLYGSKLMHTQTRKKIVLRFVFWQAVSWIFLSLLAFAAWKNIFSPALPILLIIGITLLFTLGGIPVPAWFSWMGDLVPEKDRGKYFSARNIAVGIVGLAAVLVGAAILEGFKRIDLAILGFVAIFLLASIFRFISFMLFKYQYSPKAPPEKGVHVSLRSFVTQKSNYRRLVIYLAAFNFAVMIASPFFALYMLDELKFSPLMYGAVTISSSVFYLLFTPIVGRFADRFGNRPLFIIANFLFFLSPILWMIYKSPLALIFIPQLVVGLANAALIIATTNITYDAVKPEHRGSMIAYTNLLVGIGIFVGSIIGGILLQYTSFIPYKPFFFVFSVAAAARFLVGIIFLPMLKEERKVERLPPLSVSIAHPFRALHADIGWFKLILSEKKEK